MSRQMCASQDDLAHTVAEILLTTGNEKKKGTARDRRTTARQRKEPRSKGAGLGDSNNRLHKRMPETF